MMITNQNDLPAPLVSALSFDDYDKGDANISTSGTIQPVRIRQLEIRHADEITEDASERLWLMLGSIGHKIIERADTTNHLSEERIYAKVAGWTVSGKADLLGPDMILDDFKFTSVWAIKELKPEWEQQLNVYAWLYRKNGFEVKQARIIAVLRDWSKLRAKREPEYPQTGVVIREVPLWTPVVQEDFVTNRVIQHRVAEGSREDQLPLCTEKERWHKPDTWAVKKKGNKRAVRVFNDQGEAASFASCSGKPDLWVEHRPGVDVRCVSYCRVAQFCSHGRALAGTTTEGEEVAA